jgi:molybdopterin/thiamine biosynthesis adenylyltransferase
MAQATTTPSAAPRQALILDGNNPIERAVLHNLREQTPAIQVLDLYADQLRDLIKLKNPQERLTAEELNSRVQAQLQQTDTQKQGCWIYYPWKQTLVHSLSKQDFIEVRTVRNRYKITTEEQDQLAACKVGIVGLSVGQSVALTLAMERIVGSMRLADFDTLELSNLNRIRAGIHNLGELKTTVVSREIAEIDPFIQISCYDKGLTADNIQEFITGLDVVIDECDDLRTKILLRMACRELRIPVVMDTSDLLMIDVERFDLEPERPIFHGLVSEDILHEEDTPQWRASLFQAIVEPQKASLRALNSLGEIGKSITTWPQLASDVAMGGALTAKIVKEILLGSSIPSGRMRLDIVSHFESNAEFRQIPSLRNV